jgi:hypothetical protein
MKRSRKAKKKVIKNAVAQIAIRLCPNSTAPLMGFQVVASKSPSILSGKP